MLVGVIVVLVVAIILYSAGVIAAFPERARVASRIVTGSLCRVPAVSPLCSTSMIAAIPKINRDCAYISRFQVYYNAATALIGTCTSDVDYHEFGDSMQYSANGVRLWQKDSDTVYFFTDSSTYAYLQNQSQLLRKTNP